jgi:rhodanese-related sulfurtransferase
MKIESYDNPKNQNFNIEGVKHVSPNDVLSSLFTGSVILLDVRDQGEVDIEWVEDVNVLFYPVHSVVDRLSNIPKDKAICVLSMHGESSSKIANLLFHQGYAEVYNVDGGLIAWKKNELPTESILSNSCGDCGSCSSCS